MNEGGANMTKHLSTFNRCIADLQRTDEVYKSKDKARMLLTSLPPSYKYFRMTLMFDKGTLKYEEVMQDILMHHRIVQCLRGVSQNESLVGKLGENDRSSKCEAKKSNRVWSKSRAKDGCFECESKYHWKKELSYMEREYKQMEEAR